MNGRRSMQVITGLWLAGFAAGCGGDGGGPEPEELNLERQQIGTSGVPASDPSVAVDRAGRFAVVWAEGDPRQAQHVYLQRFTAAGFTDGARVSVGTGRTPVAAFGLGDELFVAWGDGTGSQLQRYAANGSPMGAPARLSSEGFPWDLGFGAGSQGVLLSGNNSCIPGTVCAVDRFAITRLGGDGSPAGPARIYTQPGSFFHHATVAVQADGSFEIAAWGYTSNGTQLQRFAVDGSPAGSPVGSAAAPSWLRAVPGGGFVHLYRTMLQSPDVRGQRHTADGTSLGAVFTVPINSPTAFAVGPDGSMVVVGPVLDNGHPVQAHRLNADGTPAGAPILLSNETLFAQSVALGAQGRFLVALFFPGDASGPAVPMSVQLFTE